MRCSVLCKGTYINKILDPALNNCSGYNISFKLNKTLTTKLADFRCGIKNCLVEVINYNCTFNRNYTRIALNKTSSKKEDQQDTKGRNRSSIIEEDQKYHQDTDGANRSCIGNVLSFCLLYKKAYNHSLNMMRYFIIHRTWY